MVPSDTGTPRGDEYKMKVYGYGWVYVRVRVYIHTPHPRGEQQHVPLVTRASSRRTDPRHARFKQQNPQPHFQFHQNLDFYRNL